MLNRIIAYNALFILSFFIWFATLGEGRVKYELSYVLVYVFFSCLILILILAKNLENLSPAKRKVLFFLNYFAYFLLLAFAAPKFVANSEGAGLEWVAIEIFTAIIIGLNIVISNFYNYTQNGMGKISKVLVGVFATAIVLLVVYQIFSVVFLWVFYFNFSTLIDNIFKLLAFFTGTFFFGFLLSIFPAIIISKLAKK
ncbi:hypothetical protein KBC40_02615 [Patescibacteria group bacterium]|nr:hypothetical protein [Patescibacteria group bacterium]